MKSVHIGLISAMPQEIGNTLDFLTDVNIKEFGDLKNVMKQVSDFEDQFEIELKFRNPYLTAYGWKKIEYPKDLNKNEKKLAD